MKKILSLILALALCVCAVPVTAFADAASADGLFGVIVDADGNIVERLQMTRGLYTNKLYTIPAGGSFITYQYEPTNFLFGFCTKDSDGNVVTPSNTKFRLSLQYSNTIGSNKTTYEQIDYNIGDSNSDRGGAMFYRVNEGDPRYWNGEIINMSSIAATVRVVVIMNTDDVEGDLSRYF